MKKRLRKTAWAIAISAVVAFWGLANSVASATQMPPANGANKNAQTAHRAQAKSAVPRMPVFRFENFTTANGLPDNHVYAVLVDGDRIWAGTDNGLAVYENHAWKTYTTRDGLAHRAVLSLALDKRTGDVWAGTMGGLSRISAGRIDSYTQLNSGRATTWSTAFQSRAKTFGSPPRPAPAG